MWKLAKLGLLAVIIAGGGIVAVKGTSLGSYLRTGTTTVQEAVQGAVPVDFELKRASQMIRDILPDLQAQVRMIAQEEVEIAALTADIEASEQRLQNSQQALAGLRERMRAQPVAYEPHESDRAKLAKDLQQRFHRVRQAEVTLTSKRRLLHKRQEGLEAALTMLDSMRHRKSELEQKVEALAAQHRLVQATAIDQGQLADGSQLAGADQLLQQIQKRLDVAERVLEHEQQLFPAVDTTVAVDESQLLAEVDEYMSDQSQTTLEITTLSGPTKHHHE